MAPGKAFSGATLWGGYLPEVTCTSVKGEPVSARLQRHMIPVKNVASGPLFRAGACEMWGWGLGGMGGCEVRPMPGMDGKDGDDVVPISLSQ